MSTPPSVDDALGFTTRQLHAPASRGEVRSRTTPIYLTAGFVLDDFDQAAEHFSIGRRLLVHPRRATRPPRPSRRRVAAPRGRRRGAARRQRPGRGRGRPARARAGRASTSCRRRASTRAPAACSSTTCRASASRPTSSTTRTTRRLGAPHPPRRRARCSPSRSRTRRTTSSTSRRSPTVAHAHGIPLIVDNTLATPYLLRPLEHGADIVVHSASKFLAGHGAVLGGVDRRQRPLRRAALRRAVPAPHRRPSRLGGPSFADRVGGRARIAYLRESVALRFGPTASPLNAFLIGQGIETLSLRVERQSRERARRRDAGSTQQPEVHSVDYSGLRDEPVPRARRSATCPTARARCSRSRCAAGWMRRAASSTRSRSSPT